MKHTLYAIILMLSVSACGSIPRIIVLHDPLTAEEHMTLGLAYEKEGKFDLAVQEYEKAIKLSDNDYRPYFFTGNAYYKKNEYKHAEKYYNKALKIAPDNGDVHNNLAWVYIDAGDYGKAVAAAERAVGIKRSPYYLNTLAHAYFRMDRYNEALEILNEAMIKTSEEDVELLDNENKLMNELKQKMDN